MSQLLRARTLRLLNAWTWAETSAGSRSLLLLRDSQTRRSVQTTHTHTHTHTHPDTHAHTPTWAADSPGDPAADWQQTRPPSSTAEFCSGPNTSRLSAAVKEPLSKQTNKQTNKQQTHNNRQPDRVELSLTPSLSRFILDFPELFSHGTESPRQRDTGVK